VGYDLYCKLLDQTVKELKGLPVEKKVETQLEFKVDAYIPDSYIGDEKQKVEIYRRIASIETDIDYSDVTEEIKDRFGGPPLPVVNLLLLSYIKSLCQGLGIAAVEQRGSLIRVQFTEDAPVKPRAIVGLLNEYPGKIKFQATAAPGFTFKTDATDPRRMLLVIKSLLEKIICFNRG
ncbi:MAG: transcription-repair coupling factor, partial [Clostridiales bacterium]|nr:transcription-repair coupling factor [Clostridiales bacterium]